MSSLLAFFSLSNTHTSDTFFLTGPRPSRSFINRISSHAGGFESGQSLTSLTVCYLLSWQVILNPEQISYIHIHSSPDIRNTGTIIGVINGVKLHNMVANDQTVVITWCTKQRERIQVSYHNSSETIGVPSLSPLFSAGFPCFTTSELTKNHNHTD